MSHGVNVFDLNEIDALNRERALDGASFIVEAPAGAGKTELLTQRYLKLLSTVHEPEEIIALTFTNKAATEMRHRILLSLENAQRQTHETAPHKLKTRVLAEAALAQSKAQSWDILSQPSRLRILTIDALCSSLTRQMPLLSKFGGQPAVTNDHDMHYAEAARRAISSIEHETCADDTVTTVLSHLDNNSESLSSLLAKMLTMRDQWLPYAVDLHGREIDELADNARLALKNLIEECLKHALTLVPVAVQKLLMPIARYAASQLEADSNIAPLLDWCEPLTTDAQSLPQWQALAKFLTIKSEKTYRASLTKKEGFPATDEGRTYKSDYFEVVGRLEHSHVIAGLLDLPNLAQIAENQGVIHALTRLLILAERHLWIVFQAAREVDFVAIAQSAQWALENEQGATDLALKLDYKISHLLVDEFQDTSPVQMRLIEKLIEGWQPHDGRTLFCVGDPMQSIYRFRKADVSLFLQASTFGIGHLPLTRLQLTRNNRSHLAVVDWINHTFKAVFPKKDNINQGAISYREFTATRNAVAGEGVSLHPLVVDDVGASAEEAAESLNLKQIEARYVADLIVKLRAADVPPKTIAVLVRNRSHLKELVSEIRRNHRGLKFQALEIEQLNERQTVQDAFSLLCALRHRGDRVHWLNVLRAPWCGLTLADLHTLAADNHQLTIWQLMQDDARIAKLSKDGQMRLAHVKSVLATALNGQGRMPLRRWLESTWLQLGGGWCLVDVGDNRDVQVFFDLVEKVSRRGNLEITTLELAMKKLYAEPDMEADGSVQFLTIHKSKGLEFDTVILPALNRKPRSADNALLLWQEVAVDNHLHLIAAPLKNKALHLNKGDTDVYDFLKCLEKQRAENELVRLLYVAATRAERQLHLIASVKVNKKGELKPIANSLLEVLWPVVAADFSHATALQCEDVSSGLDIHQFVPKLQRLPSCEIANSIVNVPFENSSPEVDVNKWSAHQLTATLSFDEAAKSAALYKSCGTLAHLYMELFAHSDLSTWTVKRLQGCLAAMQKWLIQQGHAQVPAERAALQVFAALNITLASQEGQWVLQKHDQAASELSLIEVNDSGLKNHVIDRTFIAEGMRWIVDYKLTPSSDLAAFAGDLNVIAEQHRPQLERYAQLFADEPLPVKKAVFFLSVAKLVEL